MYDNDTAYFAQYGNQTYDQYGNQTYGNQTYGNTSGMPYGNTSGVPPRRALENGVEPGGGRRGGFFGGLFGPTVDEITYGRPVLDEFGLDKKALDLTEEEEFVEFSAMEEGAALAAGALLAPEVAIPIAATGALAYMNASASSGRVDPGVLEEKSEGLRYRGGRRPLDETISSAVAGRVGGVARGTPLFPGRASGVGSRQPAPATPPVTPPVTPPATSQTKDAPPGGIATTIKMAPPPLTPRLPAPQQLPPYYRASTASMHAAPKFETQAQTPPSGLAVANTFATPHVPTPKAWWWDPLSIPVVPTSQGEFVEIVERQILNRVPVSISKHVDSSKFVQYRDAVVRARIPVDTLDEIWTDTSADGPRIRRAHWLAMTTGKR